MVKIIETNLSMADMIVMDHQSRVIEVSSWEDYCNAFENYNGDTVEFKSLTSMFGSTIPREVGVYNLKYDDLAKLDGFKDKKIYNLLSSIEKSKTSSCCIVWQG